MQYPAIITHEDGATLALFVFQDGSECSTFADSDEEVLAMAREALEGRLEQHLKDSEPVPRPPRRAPRVPRGGRILWVPVSTQFSALLAIRFAREEAGITQAELARRMRVRQQIIARLERPGSNPTVGTLDRVANALGRSFDIHLGFGARAGAVLRAQAPVRRRPAGTRGSRSLPAKKRAVSGRGSAR